MSGITGFLKGVGAVRLALIFGVTTGVAAALFFLIAGSGSAERSLLYAGLTPSDAAQVAQQLDQAGIRYEVGDGGSAFYVDRDQVSQARVLLASEGALNSGTVGYEIFDESDALGATQFVQNVNARRATEGELARTILTIRGITAARVHLVLPERRLFERDSAEPTATVVIGLADPSLAGSHARTISRLVASAVPSLNSSRVTVIDEQGRTLANGGGDEEEMGGALLDDRRASVEERLRAKVLDALSPMVGADGARVQVAAEVDLTRVQTSSEVYDPDTQVVLSSTVIEETTSDQDRERGGAVSVSGNLPDQAETEGGAPTSSSASERVEETFNYENSRTTTTQVREAGEIERLSVAVAVDQARVVDDEGNVTWRPRTDEELTQIAAVARAAVGFNEARGDVIEVTSMPFERPQLNLGAPAPGGFSLDKNDMLRFAEVGVMLIVGLALIFLVARPLAKGLAAPMPQLAGAGGAPIGQAALADQQAGKGQARVAGKDGQDALPAPERGAKAEQDEEQAGIDIGQVDGKVKASTVRRISEVVDHHPEESMAILRTWMHES